MAVIKSCAQVLCSVLFALIAVLIGTIASLKTKPDNITIDLAASHDHSVSCASLTKEQIETYHRDGVVFVPGLLSEEKTSQVAQAIDAAIPRSVFTLFDIFATSNYAKIMFDLWRIDETVAQLSLQALPQVAAQLNVGAGSEENKIRLLRDAYFNYESGGKGCGWHVDDEGFWPAAKDTAGVTIWIALDEMKVENGGGLAVANGTHNIFKDENWIRDCYKVIQGKTCAMETLSPECHSKLEAIKVQWDMNPGDAILWNRWSFHRTAVGSNDGDQQAQLRRYSVRYMPSNAKAMGAVHHSVSQGGSFDSPYYPQVYPELIKEEVEALKHGLEGDVTPANVAKNIGGILMDKLYGLFK